uniref:Uncharacterized protein n=1 Tax=Aegilops tauschii subsp. strangulata TaxID=200361 RepID=A0A453QD39_AEGTS
MHGCFAYANTPCLTTGMLLLILPSSQNSQLYQKQSTDHQERIKQINPLTMTLICVNEFLPCHFFSSSTSSSSSLASTNFVVGLGGGWSAPPRVIPLLTPRRASSHAGHRVRVGWVGGWIGEADCTPQLGRGSSRPLLRRLPPPARTSRRRAGPLRLPRQSAFAQLRRAPR